MLRDAISQSDLCPTEREKERKKKLQLGKGKKKQLEKEVDSNLSGGRPPIFCIPTK